MTNKANSSNHLRNRQQLLNQVAKEDAYVNRKNNKPTSTGKSLKRTPKQGRYRSNVFFNTDYIVNLMSLIALIINTIMRGFSGTYIFIIPNIIFVFLYVFMASYIDPRRLASDNKTHIRPNLNTLYARIRMDCSAALQRVGKNLEINPITTINLVFIVTIITSIISMFSYGSNMTAVVIPLVLLYIMRLFAGNSFRLDSKNLNVYKWILVLILFAQSLISVKMNTSFDYTLFVIISIFNSLHVFTKYTYIYGRHEVPGEEYE